MIKYGIQRLTLDLMKAVILVGLWSLFCEGIDEGIASKREENEESLDSKDAKSSYNPEKLDGIGYSYV